MNKYKYYRCDYTPTTTEFYRVNTETNTYEYLSHQREWKPGVSENWSIKREKAKCFNIVEISLEEIRKTIIGIKEAKEKEACKYKYYKCDNISLQVEYLGDGVYPREEYYRLNEENNTYEYLDKNGDWKKGAIKDWPTKMTYFDDSEIVEISLKEIEFEKDKRAKMDKYKYFKVVYGFGNEYYRVNTKDDTYEYAHCGDKFWKPGVNKHWFDKKWALSGHDIAEVSLEETGVKEVKKAEEPRNEFVYVLNSKNYPPIIKCKVLCRYGKFVVIVEKEGKSPVVYRDDEVCDCVEDYVRDTWSNE